MMPNQTTSWLSYVRLMRLDKPIGILLLLWPTLWGLWLAGEGDPDVFVTIIFVLGVVLMRSAGCVINDFADRKVDSQVERTKHRPLATGEMSSKQALVLFTVLIVISFLLVLQLDWFTVQLSVVAIFLATVYPFMKRYTHFPQVYLGAAFGWAIPMAFSAMTGTLDNRLWLFFAITVIWAVVYDTMYAMVDREDDLKVGIKSTAVIFGRFDRLIIGVLQVAMLILLYLGGEQFGLGYLYQAGIFITVVLMIYHQWLIRDRKKDLCFKAFLHNHWIGFVLFVSIAADYAFI